MMVIKIRLSDECKSSFLGGTDELSDVRGECKDCIPSSAFSESTSTVSRCVANLESAPQPEALEKAIKLFLQEDWGHVSVCSFHTGLIACQ